MSQELLNLSVRIQTEKQGTIGSGLLYLPQGQARAYVLTAAHVVEKANGQLLIQCYPDKGFASDEFAFCVEPSAARKHPRYVSSTSIQPCDAAIVPLPYRTWMDSRSRVFFGEADEDMPLEGYVYTTESPEEDLKLAHFYFSPQSVVVGVSRESHRFNAFLDGPHCTDPSERRSEWAGSSGGVLTAAYQDEITLVGMILGMPGQNGHLGMRNMADMTAISELLKEAGVLCNYRTVIKNEESIQAAELAYDAIIPDRFFVHREEELAQIESILAQSGIVALSGMGGIGKSGLAEQFAANAINNYRSCQIISCRDSIAAGLVSQLKISGIRRGYVNGVPEDDTAYSNRLLAALKRQTPNTFLLILDDVDPGDPLYSEIAVLRHHRIITSRCIKDQWQCPVIEIEAMDFNSQKDLFEQYLGYELNKDEMQDFRVISGIVGGHTLTLQLIALQCSASDYTVTDIRLLLSQNGIYTENPDQFSYGRTDQERNMYGHIRAIWNLSAFSDVENWIMQGLCLIPGQGIPRRTYKEWMGLSNMNTVNRLRRKGWIRSRRADDVSRTDYISLHHVISEVVYQELYLQNQAELTDLINGVTRFVNQRNQPVEQQSYWLAIGIYMGQRLLRSISAALLLNQVGLHLEYMRDFALALEILQNARQYLIDLNAKSDILYAHTLNNIAMTYHSAKDYAQSMAHYKEAVIAYRRLGKKARGNYAYALHNYARLLWFSGNHETAMKTEDEAEPKIKVFFREHLGEVYDLRRDDHSRRAMEAAQKFEKLRKMPNPDPKRLRVLYLEYERHGKMMLKYAHAAVEEKQRYNSEDSFENMRSLAHLACAKAQIEEDPSAKDDIQTVLNYYQVSTGEESVYVGNTYCEMCMIYENLNDPGPACRFGEKAVRILTLHEGPSSEAVAIARENLRIAQKSLSEQNAN